MDFPQTAQPLASRKAPYKRAAVSTDPYSQAAAGSFPMSLDIPQPIPLALPSPHCHLVLPRGPAELLKQLEKEAQILRSMHGKLADQLHRLQVEEYLLKRMLDSNTEVSEMASTMPSVGQEPNTTPSVGQDLDDLLARGAMADPLNQYPLPALPYAPLPGLSGLGPAGPGMESERAPQDPHTAVESSAPHPAPEGTPPETHGPGHGTASILDGADDEARLASMSLPAHEADGGAYASSLSLPHMVSLGVPMPGMGPVPPLGILPHEGPPPSAFSEAPNPLSLVPNAPSRVSAASLPSAHLAEPVGASGGSAVGVGGMSLPFAPAHTEGLGDEGPGAGIDASLLEAASMLGSYDLDHF